MTRLATPGLLITLGFLAVSIAFIWEASSLSFASRIFPSIIGGVLVVLCIVQLYQEYIKAKRSIELTDNGDAEIDHESVQQKVRSFAWAMSLLVGIALFGTIVAVPLFLLIFMTVHGEKLVLSASLAAGLTLFLVGGLQQFLHIRLPEGLLWMLF